MKRVVYPSMRGKLQLIERFIKQKLTEMPYPTTEDIQIRNIERAYSTLKAKLDDFGDDVQHPFIERLLKDGYTYDHIVQALITDYIPKDKTYDNLQMPTRRVQESRNTNTQDGRKGREDRSASRDKYTANYKMAKINLGKDDGFRPVSLLDYLDRKSVGRERV